MKKRVYAYLHTHWDREWYRDKEDFNLRLIEVLDVALDELKNDKAPFFYLDGQISALSDYLKFRKEKKAEVIDLIQKKKLAIGPYFVSADSYLTSFCSMLKNLEFGIKYSKEFNQKDFIGYMADIFGISKSVFEALKLYDINKAIIWRGVNPKDINNSCCFKYDKIDTCWLVQGYFNDFLHSDMPIEKKAQNIKNYLDKINLYSGDTLLLPLGGDHLGMLKNANEIISQINNYLDDYEIILSSPFEYFKKAKNDFKPETKTKEFLDNEKTYVLKGVYSTRIPQKIKNSLIQNRLSRIIEPLNFFLGDKYEKNIEFIYETLIKNHAHDGIYGCSIDDVAKTVDYRFLKAQNAINAVEKKLIGNFMKKHGLSGKSKDKIGLFNLSNTPVSLVKIKLPYILNNAQVIKKEKGFPDDLLYDIYKTPVTEDITDLYTQIAQIDEVEKLSFNVTKIKKPKKQTFITPLSLENGHIKLEIKDKKIFVTDKKTNKKVELKLTDIKDDGDSYNFAPKGDYGIYKPLKTSVFYDGNIESCLKIKFNSLELYAILNNNSKFIKFKAKINNKKKNHKLQFAVITNDKIKKTTSDDALGVINRKIDPDYDIRGFMPAKRPYELKINDFPMQNFVNANGINILSTGLNEYEVYKNELRLCLLRSIGTISNPKNKTRGIPAGPDLKTPEMQCLGRFETEFAIMFGNYKEAVKNLDIFKENRIGICADFKKDLSITFAKIPKNLYFYGIFKNKTLNYDISSEKIELI